MLCTTVCGLRALVAIATQSTGRKCKLRDRRIVYLIVLWQRFSARRKLIVFQVTTEFITGKNPLLHICDLDDTALCLRVLWILHHSYVQFFLAFTECYVCCAITRGDLKYM
jgi:hypothetical protein